MKKYFFLAAAVLSAVSCSIDDVKAVDPAEDQEEGYAATLSVNNVAVEFNSYTPAAVTKGTIVTGDELDSIGVFAFRQDNAAGQKVYFNTHRHSVPNFMYNQLVRKESSGEWSYSPVKYWPNNVGDQLSFFAYAPYDEHKNWEDMGISTDAVGKTMKVSFPIYAKVSDQCDYLWATPQINRSNASTVGTGGYGVSDKVSFTFEHITSQISLYVGVAQDQIAISGWSDDNTLITVNSIVFTGMGESIEYCYDLPDGSLSSDYPKSKGSRDITLTEDDFQNHTSESWSGATYYELLKKEKNSRGADESGFMFVAPMSESDLSESAVIITYTVATTDTASAANSFTHVNTITRKWSDFAGTISKIEQGKAYRLQFLIGMNDVDFGVEETEWEDPTVHQVDIPANEKGEPHYIEGNGVSTTDYGPGITIDCGTLYPGGIFVGEVTFAPVNCGVGYNYENPVGLFYQWGRRYGQSVTTPTLTPTTITFEQGQSTEYRDVFGKGTNWFSDVVKNDTWLSGAKGEYDPCPDGWRVPSSTELRGLFRHFSERTTDSGGIKGCYFSGSQTYSADVPQVFLPELGYRYNADGKIKHDTSGDCYYFHYWLGDIHASANAGLAIQFIFNDGGPSGYDTVIGYDRAYGCSVRCVLITE